MFLQLLLFSVLAGIALIVPSILYIENTPTTPPIQPLNSHSPRVFKKSEQGFTIQVNMPFSELYEKVKEVKHVTLFISVLSAPLGRERRDNIRKTWWKECNKPHGKVTVVCKFFTDKAGVGVSEKILEDLEEEKQLYRDLIFTPITGAKLGMRFLYIFQWANANYDFKYLARIDDDVLLCLPQFIIDMASFPKRYFFWGYLHCGDQLVYLDEGITAFSSDVVRKFLSQDPEFLLCHEYGDQTIALWIQTLGFNVNKLYHPESRFHFHPPASKIPNFCKNRTICDKYIAVHGLYHNDMLECWKNRGPITKLSTYKRIYTSDVCHQGSFMDWTRHSGKYRREPRLCLDPIWNELASPYKGRQT